MLDSHDKSVPNFWGKGNLLPKNYFEIAFLDLEFFIDFRVFLNRLSARIRAFRTLFIFTLLRLGIYVEVHKNKDIHLSFLLSPTPT